MDMQNISNLLLVALVSLLAAISPGPDFLIVVRNNLVYSRKVGFLTSLGVSIALIIHLSYTLIGIGVLIAESVFLYNLIKYAGVLYLFYLGVSSVRASFKVSNQMDLQYARAKEELSTITAIKQGFLTNLLNPKCAMFFVSLFSQFITADTPMYVRLEYAVINVTVSLGWFLFLSYLITGKFLASKMDRFRSSIDRVMGGLLMLLSVRMLFV
jgi:RhtB (resistance to homoserine/threonine) family protein